MGCMTCGKSKATKTKSYSPKKSSMYRQGSSSPFGQPKVLKGFSSRNR